MRRSLTIAGQPFEITVAPAAKSGGAREWEWTLAAPGQLLLSGSAADETRALAVALRTARNVVRLRSKAA